MTHICINKVTIIGSDNGLSSGWDKAINWTNAGILLIGTLATKFIEILSEINTFFSKENFRIKYRLRNGGSFVSASMFKE